MPACGGDGGGATVEAESEVVLVWFHGGVCLSWWSRRFGSLERSRCVGQNNVINAMGSVFFERKKYVGFDL